MALEFQIIIDDSFVSLNKKPGLAPIELKHVLSIANGFEDEAWRIDRFEEFIWNHVAETALSERERASLVDSGYSALRAAAKNLRLTDKTTDPTKGSEIAEIVLYGVMKRHYGALPVVPKIFYKQNARDFAKGADSVHIVAAAGGFSLWFGEAKFYSSIEDARLGPVVDSIAECLSTEKLRKETSIVTNLRELDDLEIEAELRVSIRESLAPKISIDEIKPMLNIPILLLHECKITSAASEMSESYTESIKEFHIERAHSYFSKQIEMISSKIKHYEKIHFHLILIPVPSKADIVDRFLSTAEQLKG